MEERQWIKLRCKNDHLFGDATKPGSLNELCPKCKEGVVGVTERVLMSVDVAEARGWIGSMGDAS